MHQGGGASVESANRRILTSCMVLSAKELRMSLIGHGNLLIHHGPKGLRTLVTGKYCICIDQGDSRRVSQDQVILECRYIILGNATAKD